MLKWKVRHAKLVRWLVVKVSPFRCCVWRNGNSQYFKPRNLSFGSKTRNNGNFTRILARWLVEGPVQTAPKSKSAPKALQARFGRPVARTMARRGGRGPACRAELAATTVGVREIETRTCQGRVGIPACRVVARPRRATRIEVDAVTLVGRVGAEIARGRTYTPRISAPVRPLAAGKMGALKRRVVRLVY